jgi:serine/threonine protein kinase
LRKLDSYFIGISFRFSQETGQKAAVKIVSKKKLSDEDYQALMMEIQILSELDHPHIIK